MERRGGERGIDIETARYFGMRENDIGARLQEVLSIFLSSL